MIVDSVADIKSHVALSLGVKFLYSFSPDTIIISSLSFLMSSRIKPTAAWGKDRGSRGINPARQLPPEKHQPPKSDRPVVTQPPWEKPANQDSAIHVGSQCTSKNLHPGLAHIAYNSVHCTSTQKQSDVSPQLPHSLIYTYSHHSQTVKNSLSS